MFLSFLLACFVVEVLTSQNFGRSVNGVAFHPTKNILASCSSDNSIKLWNTDTATELSTLKVDAGKYGVQSVSFSPKGDMVAAGCHNGNIFFVDAAAGEIKSSLRGHTNSVWSVCFSPDGTKSRAAARTRRSWSGMQPLGSNYAP